MSHLSELEWKDGIFPKDPARWAPCLKCAAGRVVMMYKFEQGEANMKILTKVTCDNCGEIYEPGPPLPIPPVNV